MIGPLIAQLAASGHDVTVACRLLAVPRSSYYSWQRRAGAPTGSDVADAHLANLVFDIHAASGGSYGSPRVHAELTLGRNLMINRKKTARLLRVVDRQGICAPRKSRRATPAAAVHEDLVRRRFVVEGPDRIWCTDITEHPTSEGKVYCCAVLDVWSRMIVGWSIADHVRSELVVDALEMARWNRRPGRDTTICHSDRGSQYTSWIFGHRLRQAGLLGSMGRVASSVDNTMIESFWSTMQRELLDRRTWATKTELGTAIFEWIEGWYNPHRRHSGIGYLSPATFEAQHRDAQRAA